LNRELTKTLRNLTANNFDAKYAETAEQAKEIISNAVSKDATVGIGDSATIKQIGIIEELEKRGNRVFNPFSKEMTTDPNLIRFRGEVQRRIFSCDAFLTGTNAVTEDGKLVNIDAVGNRVASTIFGPREVFIVAGRNKIVNSVEEAIKRIKNVIAPYHAKIKQFDTPCAETGRCIDCNSSRRICNVTTIIEKRPWRTDLTVVLVNEDLGLGWDEVWPTERVDRIKSSYEKVTWVFAR